MRCLLTATLLTLAALPAAATSLTMQPGLYSITVQMEMKGMPMQLPATTFQQCITAKDVEDGKAYASSKDKDCKLTNLKQSNNRVDYDFSCSLQGGQRMQGHASGSSHAQGYSVVMSGRFVPPMEGVSEFSQKLDAKRLGACK